MIGFDRYLKGVLTRAGDEARGDGSATIEAQHLLLAMAADAGSAAGGVLVAAGLGHAALRDALDGEFERSLAAAGVTASAFGLPPATPDPERRPQPGASFRLAVERAVALGHGRAPRPEDLLLGILQAEVGTVPRTLAVAGVSRADLIARVRQAVAAES